MECWRALCEASVNGSAVHFPSLSLNSTGPRLGRGTCTNTRTRERNFAATRTAMCSFKWPITGHFATLPWAVCPWHCCLVCVPLFIVFSRFDSLLHFRFAVCLPSLFLYAKQARNNFVNIPKWCLCVCVGNVSLFGLCDLAGITTTTSTLAGSHCCPQVICLIRFPTCVQCAGGYGNAASCTVHCCCISKQFRISIVSIGYLHLYSAHSSVWIWPSCALAVHDSA